MELAEFQKSLQETEGKINARLAAIEDAQRRAVENGLLDSARQNAELLIRGFLAGTYDLQVYDVNFVR